MEIVSVEKKGRVWVGTSDLNRKGEDGEDFFSAVIKRFIRHAKSYRGSGKYGKYGGYDITLIELEKPVPEKFGTPACLPSKSFQVEMYQLSRIQDPLLIFSLFFLLLLFCQESNLFFTW